MPRFVVVLRGVNVGKSKRVPMGDFRELLSGLGYTDVSTLLNSGNAVFRAGKGAAAAHAKKIAGAIADRLEIDVPVIVKSASEMKAIIDECPIQADELTHSRFLVIFCQGPKELRGLSPIEPLVTARERFAVGKTAAYLLCSDGLLESNAGSALLGKVGKSFTTRNWATALKLNALASGPDT
jgi:uncharacterized protein (DUF1697 family)